MMSVVRWPEKMPEGGLLSQGKSTYDRNKTKVCDPLGNCEQTIQISLFFDGTNNNDDEDNVEFRDSKWRSHTNVARLHNAARHEPWNGIYRHYIAVVGTIFEKIGEDEYSSHGKALAWGYGRRCVWGYTRVLNSIYAAIMGADVDPLIRDREAKQLCDDASATFGQSFSRLFDMKHRRLAGVQHAMERDSRRNKMIKKVWINVFGFSRGAAIARSFVGKLTRDWAPGGKIAGEFDYQINFMGLFDTVASVGAPDSVQSAVNISAFDGHFGWASGGLMNIPASVNYCVHFFSIHEQRMSFPLDTIREGNAYPGGVGQRLEVAYPGMHSDVGGGYSPGDQGKARGGDGTKLSQIPLHHMYIAALGEGVPLMTQEEIIEKQGKDDHDFILNKGVVDVFNNWLDRAVAIKSVEDALRIGMRQNLAWRALRARWHTGDYLTHQTFFKAAPEDTFTPIQLEREVAGRLKTDPAMQALEAQHDALRQDGRDLVAAGGNRATTAHRLAAMKQNKVLMQKTADLEKRKTRRKEEMYQEVAGKKERTRPGEVAAETLTNDQQDLREAAEEFRLLLGLLHPDQRATLGVETLRSPALAALQRAKRPTLWGIALASYETYTNTGNLLYVPRERNRDSERVKLVDADLLVRTGAASAAVLGHRAFEPEQYDVLVLPAVEILARLREWTAPAVVNQFERQERATITLFDDYIHDSRAWFRVPHFHEYAPGGFGWGRVFFIGGDKCIRHLGYSDGAKETPTESVNRMIDRVLATMPRKAA